MLVNLFHGKQFFAAQLTGLKELRHFVPVNVFFTQWELSHRSGDTEGAFHSTENFQIFETGANGSEISWGKFQKIRKLLNFRKANHSTENSGNSGMKVKLNGNFQEKILENSGIPHEAVLFFGLYANSQIRLIEEIHVTTSSNNLFGEKLIMIGR